MRVFLAYLAVAVAFTWPLARYLTSMVPSDVGDPVLNTWILWWNSVQVPLTQGWWDAPILFPATATLAFSEHLLGLTFISSPVNWLSGSPLLSYNVTFLLTFALSATTAYMLALELTGRRDAAVLAGLAFGFSPYRVAHFSHIQMLATFWMPLALVGLHRFLKDGRARWLAVFAGAWLMQALSNGYFLVYLSVLVGLWLPWFVSWRDWRKALLIGAAWIAAGLCLVPILLKYQATHAAYGFSRNLENMRALSADVAAWLNASPLLALWGNLHVFQRAEGALFTGFVVVGLMLAGILLSVAKRERVRERPSVSVSVRRTLAFYATAAVVMYVFALGPSPTLLGERFLDSGPYLALVQLPGLQSLRAPARFGMLVALCVSIAAAIAFALLSASWRRSRQLIAATVLGVAILGESWIREMPLWPAPHAWDVRADEIPGALLVVPILNELNEAGSMFRAMSHRRPLVNGYSGYVPPWYRALKDGLDSRDPAVLEELSRTGVTTVAVVVRNDHDASWRDYVATRATLVRTSEAGGFALYRLKPVEPPPVRTPGEAVRIASVVANSSPEQAALMIDGIPHTRWHSASAQAGDEEIVLDLESRQAFTGLNLIQGVDVFDYPRELVVEISDEAAKWSPGSSDPGSSMAWTEVWRGLGAAHAIAGAFRQPTVMPLELEFGAQRARFIRLRQIGQHRRASWSIAEVRVRRE